MLKKCLLSNTELFFIRPALNEFLNMGHINMQLKTKVSNVKYLNALPLTRMIEHDDPKLICPCVSNSLLLLSGNQIPNSRGQSHFIRFYKRLPFCSQPVKESKEMFG